MKTEQYIMKITENQSQYRSQGKERDLPGTNTTLNQIKKTKDTGTARYTNYQKKKKKSWLIWKISFLLCLICNLSHQMILQSKYKPFVLIR